MSNTSTPPQVIQICSIEQNVSSPSRNETETLLRRMLENVKEKIEIIEELLDVLTIDSDSSPTTTPQAS